jgi:hypothetical protein
MKVPTENLWEQFDEVERKRRAALARHKQAFRQLDIAASATRDKGSIEAWECYCSAAKSLEASVTELERLVWKLRS